MNQTTAALHGFPSLVFERCRIFVAGAQSVLFLARRGECTLRCYVTRDALMTYFGAANGDADAGQDCLRAYDQSAVFIHSVVRRLLADGVQAASGEIVITTDLVFRHLTTARVSGSFAAVAAVAAAARPGRAVTPGPPC